MKNNKGYTLPELLVVIAIMGIATIVVLSKTSYAFSDNNSFEDNNLHIIEKQSVLYGEKNKDKFNENGELFITVKDLVEGSYLFEDENGKILNSEKDLSNIKIKITLKDDKVSSKIIK